MIGDVSIRAVSSRRGVEIVLQVAENVDVLAPNTPFLVWQKLLFLEIDQLCTKINASIQKDRFETISESGDQSAGSCPEGAQDLFMERVVSTFLPSTFANAKPMAWYNSHKIQAGMSTHSPALKKSR
jgi:hypothetical protein